jgi:hypothetical protein
MPCTSHPHWFDHSNYIWRRVQVMKLLIMQFSPIWESRSLAACTLGSNRFWACNFPRGRDEPTSIRNKKSQKENYNRQKNTNNFGLANSWFYFQLYQGEIWLH